jgi:hypothetical protein
MHFTVQSSSQLGSVVRLPTNGCSKNRHPSFVSIAVPVWSEFSAILLLLRRKIIQFRGNLEEIVEAPVYKFENTDVGDPLR